jgi:glycine/D-amino acid oxidase-like deaminating enzyme
MSSKHEVVIIGAGIIGCSIGYHLAKRGVPPLMLDMDSIGARASGKSWAVIVYPPGMINMEGSDPNQLFSMPLGGVKPWVELFSMTHHRLPDIALEIKERGGVDIGYDEVLRIRVCLSEEEEKNSKAMQAKMHEQGYHEWGEWIDEKELKTIYPDINPKARGGMLTTSLQLEPYQYTLGMGQSAERLGGEVLLREAVGFRTNGSKITSVICSSGSEIEGDVFVIAMGPWTSLGTSWLGKEIPVMINREQCLRLEVPEKLPYGLSSSESGVILPKVDGSVILGHAGVADIQTSFDVPIITEEVKNRLMDESIRLLPRLGEAKLIEHRGDFEGWSPPPNRIQPVLGRLTEWDNAYVAARLGTLGQTMSLGAGESMAELIVNGGRSPHRFKYMMDYLSPARLKLDEEMENLKKLTANESKTSI